MIYAITSSKDTTLYESEPTQNTGLDGILQISKEYDLDEPTEFNNSRFLIQFNLTGISASISAGTITSPSFYMKLYETERQNVPLSYTIYAHPVSESWEMGYGKLSDFPITTVGSSWTWKDYYPSGSNWALSGSSYISNTSMSTDFAYESKDIYIDATTIVNQWLSASISNYGFVFKRSDTDESSSAWFGTLNFYGKETHTIYEPRLYVKWDDSSWSIKPSYYVSHSLAYKESTYLPSASLSSSPTYDFYSGSMVYEYYSAMAPLTAENIDVFSYRLGTSYKRDSKILFRVQGREKYIQKTFNRRFHSSSVQYLPSSSYYSILDAHTNETIIPFDDDYTKLSLDYTGNYFKLWMDQFNTDRYYKFAYKIVSGSETKFFDNNFIFKVEK